MMMVVAVVVCTANTARNECKHFDTRARWASAAWLTGSKPRNLFLQATSIRNGIRSDSTHTELHAKHCEITPSEGGRECVK